MFYNTEQTSLCDICEGEDCHESCKIHASKQRSGDSSDDDIIRSTGSIAGVATVLLISSAVYLISV